MTLMVAQKYSYGMDKLADTVRYLISPLGIAGKSRASKIKPNVPIPTELTNYDDWNVGDKKRIIYVGVGTQKLVFYAFRLDIFPSGYRSLSYLITT